VKQLFGVWLDICLLRAAPQDLPASGWLLALSLAGYVSANFLLALASWRLEHALLATAADVLLLTAFTRLILQWWRLPSRFAQTLSALTGSGALLALAALPSAAGIGHGQAETAVTGVLTLVWLALLVWSVVVMGHVLRHALSASFSTGVALSLLYTVASIALVGMLIPPST